MSNYKGDKPVTLDQLGVTFGKFISPIYTRLDKLEQDVNGLKKDVEELKGLKKDVEELKGLKKDVEEVKNIQLRMENKILDNIKLLHDRDDMHDKKLKDHDRKISKLEKTL